MIKKMKVKQEMIIILVTVEVIVIVIIVVVEAAKQQVMVTCPHTHTLSTVLILFDNRKVLRDSSAFATISLPTLMKECNCVVP